MNRLVAESPSIHPEDIDANSATMMEDPWIEYRRKLAYRQKQEVIEYPITASIPPVHRLSPYASSTKKALSIQAENEDLGLFLDDLDELMKDTEQDDDSLLPTAYARTRVLDLVIPALSQMNRQFPYASLGSDDEGGIRIEWAGNNRELRLAIPARPGGLEYIYYEQGDKYQTIKHLTSDVMALFLDWVATS